MSETTYRFNPGCLVQCSKTGKIGFIMRTLLAESSFVCQVSWGDGSIEQVSHLDIEVLDSVESISK